MTTKTQVVLFALMTVVTISLLAKSSKNSANQDDQQEDDKDEETPTDKTNKDENARGRTSQLSQDSNPSKKKRSLGNIPEDQSAKFDYRNDNGDDDLNDIAHRGPFFGSMCLDDLEKDKPKRGSIFNALENQLSTAKWVFEYATNSFYLPRNRDLVLNAKPTTDSTKRPINILCFDGGGARGLTLKVVYQELEKMLGAPLRDEFDLVAGTSIGGIAALFTNQFEGMGEVPENAGFLGKQIAAGSLRAPDILKLIKTGCLLNDNRTDLLRHVLGKDTPIKNDRSPKAFVVAATKDDKDGDLEPYLIRTYEAPNVPNALPDDFTVVDGTCQMKSWEAAVATSAAPVAYDRIEVEVENGEEVKLADGGVVANDPTELALYEAVALFPDHPIGLVLSIGCGREKAPENGVDDQACFPEIEEHVRELGGEYCRFNPVIGKFPSTLASQEKLDKMEKKLETYMGNTAHAKAVNDLLRKHAELRDKWEERKEEECRPSSSTLFRSVALPRIRSSGSSATSGGRYTSGGTSYGKSTSTATTADTTIASGIPELPDSTSFGSVPLNAGGFRDPRRGRRPPPAVQVQ